MTRTSPFRALSQLINRKLSLPAMCILALGLMLASSVTATAAPFRITLDPALTQEVSGNGNGMLEPGEIGLVGIRVRNTSDYDLSAMYIDVDSYDVYVNGYNDIYGYWDSGEERILYVQIEAFTGDCGAYSANLDVTIEWRIPFHHPPIHNTQHDSVSVPIEYSTNINTKTFSYTGPPVVIPDNSETGEYVYLDVSGIATVTDLEFIINGSSCTSTPGAPGVGLDHANVHDLVLTLISPSGTTVNLINRPGDSTNAGSNFCRMVLDDNPLNPSIQSIAAGGAPYPGTFEPANPLSAFIGEDPNGTWMLNVSDHAAGNTGQVNAFSLTITDNTPYCNDLYQNITGRVTTNGTTGFSGVRVGVTGSEAYSVATDENGNYTLSDLYQRGDYTVTPYKLGYLFNPVRKYFSVLDIDQTADFTATKANFSISGRVLSAGSTTGLSGVTMKLTGDRVRNITTDADGNYTFPNLPASGNYTVTPFLIGYKFTSASRSYSTLSANQTGQDFAGNVQSYTVGGVVSLGTAGLKGVTITLSSLTPAGFPTQTVITSSTGAYSFTNLPAGRNYKVTATKEGYQFLPLNKSLTNLSDNQTEVNFAVKVYSISGRVIRSGTTTGINSVKITLTSPTPAGFAARKVLTDSTGYYTFTNLPAGRGYTLQPTKTGFTFTPATRSITNLNKNVPAGAATNFTGSP